MTSIIQAKYFAIGAHGSQLRQGSMEPYWKHPERVANLIHKYVKSASIESMQAAWLHDVVEDTSVTIETIEEHFGALVSELVSDLTDVSTLDDGNRATRKALDRAHTANASVDAQVIKCADIIDNTKDIVALMPSFAPVFLAEVDMTLNAMQPATKQSDLWRLARSRVTFERGNL